MNYLIIIPNNFTSDLHICGRCKAQFNILNEFLEHKVLQPCVPVVDFSKDLPEKSVRSVAVGPIPIYDGKVSESSVIVSNDSFKPIEANFQAGPLDVRLEAQFHSRGKLLIDEEDVIDLLANKLSKQDTKIATDGQDESLVADIAAESVIIKKENIEGKEPTFIDKITYRGRERNVFRCTVEGCSYKSHMKKDTNRHARVHTGERPFKCRLCSKSYQRSDKLLLHERAHSGEKRHKCTECTYAAIDSGSLVRHLRVHTDERPFRCMLCPYRSRDSSQLTVHMRSHTGDSPFLCTHDQCRGAFKTQSDLRRHLAVHSEIKPYSCALCAYKSTFKGGLRNHMEKHHPDGKLSDYRCAHCSEVFSTLRKHNSHVQKAHGTQYNYANHSQSEEVPKLARKRKKINGDLVGTIAKAFSCRLCDSSFVCWSSLQAHERFHERTKLDFEKKNNQALEERFYRKDEDKKGFIQREGAVLTINPLVEKRDISDGLLASDSSYAVMEEHMRTAEMTPFPLPTQAVRPFAATPSIFYSADLPNAPLRLA